jgi:hypothetical protein
MANLDDEVARAVLGVARTLHCTPLEEISLDALAQLTVSVSIVGPAGGPLFSRTMDGLTALTSLELDAEQVADLPA